MKKVFFLLFVFCYSFFKAHSQTTVFFNDSNYFKVYCYLQISTDQLNAGLLKHLKELKNNDSFLDSIKIEGLKSTELPDGFIVFKVLVQYAKEPKPFEYIFCYNEERRQLYKIRGFYNNDFILFFDYLKTKGYKITSSYFKKKKVTIENVETECLIDLYASKRNKLLTDLDRTTHECLKYNMQPVTTY
ncbi:MAG TPA: hypothetical protein PKA46_15975 [Ferruginibacter sp.]|nr:hypothetical protein [Ferruginibacter sp.]